MNKVRVIWTIYMYGHRHIKWDAAWFIKCDIVLMWSFFVNLDNDTKY